VRYRQRSPTSKTITGELIPRAERKRSRYERATTEWKAQGEGPRTSESYNRAAHEGERRSGST